MGSSSGAGDRLAAFGERLAEVHDALREELDRLREDAGAHLAGRGKWSRELRAHCLAFCAAVERHHTGEDDGAFPVLARRYPELGAVIERLEQDHHLVAAILRRMEDLLDGVEPPVPETEARRVKGELDGLAAILESHFTYEERQITAALDSLAVPAWTEVTPAFLRRPGDEEPGD
ncbi:hemerythrin domain-containing protein [Sphaerisporangium sp. B11E5]|uniref:hemerythrin domain-containing protein n=1 Tax=Sphaerisporangium sp. B11E5 TaxID=3153563 RepID=UPI00325C7D7C